MIKNNLFYIKNLKYVVIFGFHQFIDKIIKINKKNSIKTLIICSSKQGLNYKNKENVLISNKIDLKIKKKIKSQVNIKSSLFISLGSRIIFKKNDINNFFNNNLINFHASLLPFDMGGGGFTWRILKNDRIDNQCVHLINEKIDKGYILDYHTSVFPREIYKPKDMINFSNNNFIFFYENFLKKIKSNKKIHVMKNIDYLGTYYPRINHIKDSYINWSNSSQELINFTDAFEEPYIGATTFIKLGKKTIKVNFRDVQLTAGQNNHSFISGLILKNYKDFLIVATKDSKNLIIQKVLYQNKNIIQKLKQGSRFFTPVKFLEKAKNIRTYYNT